jgi:hypothetical protein
LLLSESKREENDEQEGALADRHYSGRLQWMKEGSQRALKGKMQNASMDERDQVWFFVHS